MTHTSTHTCMYVCMMHKRSYYTIEDKGLHIHLITHIGEGCMCNLYSLSTCVHINKGVHESHSYVGFLRCLACMCVEVISTSTLIYIPPIHHHTHTLHIYTSLPPSCTPLQHINTSHTSFTHF